jgi:hypothetical protein
MRGMSCSSSRRPYFFSRPRSVGTTW